MMQWLTELQSEPRWGIILICMICWINGLLVGGAIAFHIGKRHLDRLYRDIKAQFPV